VSTRITWHQYFMAQSHLLSLRSTCTRLAVGATIVREKRIIAGGYNGSIAGGEHCMDVGCYMEEGHCIRTIHAEMNAILQCAKFGVPTQNAEIYVTHFPCVHCTKSIIQAGISSVYYANGYHNHPFSIELFEKAGVKVEHIPFEWPIIDRKNEEKKKLVQTLLDKLELSGADAETLDQLKEQVTDLFG
jgi:dCMP deaminase